MKKENLIWVGLLLACAIGVWSATSFRQTAESHFQQAYLEKECLEQTSESLKKNEDFRVHHQKGIKYLIEKSWVLPKNRLNVGKFLETLRPLVKTLSFRFEPETLKTIGDEKTFKITQITINGTADTDVDLYVFLDTLFKEFPGILISRDLYFTRNKDNGGIEGKFVMEWVAMKGKDDEE